MGPPSGQLKIPICLDTPTEGSRFNTACPYLRVGERQCHSTPRVEMSATILVVSFHTEG
jgi:hypothetical protein